jgi:hypothetical protein
VRFFSDFYAAIRHAREHLMHYGSEVDTGHWQGVSTNGKPDLVTIEVVGWDATVNVMRSETDIVSQLTQMQEEIRPNLPWADDHFEERVGGQPTNPGEAYKGWPWWTPDKEEYTWALDATRSPFRFTHTYQERFWPKQAGENPQALGISNFGIRYDYGDLNDVVQLLLTEPYTRQAYLPIFFPEDTGAVHGGRIPCTLGYHFMLRNSFLHMWYFIRSCDYIRHFRDDIYLAARLMLWVLDELKERELRSDYPQVWVDVVPGELSMVVPSLHAHKGDWHRVVAEQLADKTTA